MHPGLSHKRRSQRNRKPDRLYSCFKNYFLICFSFPLDQQGKNVSLHSWGKLIPSHTSFFSLIEFSEGVQQSAVMEVDANGCIKRVCGHRVNTKIQGEQFTICRVSYCPRQRFPSHFQVSISSQHPGLARASAELHGSRGDLSEEQSSRLWRNSAALSFLNAHRYLGLIFSWTEAADEIKEKLLHPLLFPNKSLFPKRAASVISSFENAVVTICHRYLPTDLFSLYF